MRLKSEILTQSNNITVVWCGGIRRRRFDYSYNQNPLNYDGKRGTCNRWTANN